MKTANLFACVAMLASTLAAAAEPRVAIEVIVDDSGVLSQPKKADEYKLQLLGHLKELRKKRRFAKARIDVISSSYGRSVWIGTPSDLKGPRAAPLVDAVKVRSENCNNLPGAFAELDTNLQILKSRGYDEIHVYLFSSLIHTPVPCSKESTITLPQLPPPFDINDVLTSSDAIRTVAVYWVNPHQKRPWLDHLQTTAQWLNAKGGRFALMDIENTKYQLNSRLEGLTR
ncbi:MAG: hypothetical protein H6868_00095 [Rhodospirillales bacterium]|nr:hypothetical protein [Rhodospirillales bacterium]